MTLIDDVEATIDRWAGRFSGFNWSEGRGWVPVQEMAQKFSFDPRRNGPKHVEWEASARRFIEAMNESDQWCLDPGIVALLDDAMEYREYMGDGQPTPAKKKRKGAA